MSTLSIGISTLSFAVSLVTAYLAWFARGQLKATKPTVIFFGYDLEQKPVPKIFLRTLLYSTAARGNVVESLYVKLQHDGVSQAFKVWGYGATKVEVQGSGLYVGREGVALNHFFNLRDQPAFRFTSGHYETQVFARLAGRASPLQLSKTDLVLTEQEAANIRSNAGIVFELDPENDTYVGRMQTRN